MSDAKWEALNNEVVAKGYEFQGNVRLPSDSCRYGDACCPMCGEGGYWCVWYALPDNPTQEAWTHLCYDCGHMWSEYVQLDDENVAEDTAAKS